VFFNGTGGSKVQGRGGPRSGQAKTQRTDTNVDRVWTLVRSDQRIDVRLIAEELNMNMETARKNIMED
jgi:hypothetical protein